MNRETSGRLLLGLGTGFTFGVLLQKGRVAKYETISQQLLLNDWTVVKIMSTASAVGAVGVQLLQNNGKIEKNIKPLKVGGIVLGGTLFGAGMALLGYCPGTTVAAVGEGRRDAMAGLVGMFIGAAAFVASYPKLKPYVEAGDYGKKTLPELTATSPWLWITGISVATVVGAVFLETNDGKKRHPTKQRY